MWSLMIALALTASLSASGEVMNLLQNGDFRQPRLQGWWLSGLDSGAVDFSLVASGRDDFPHAGQFTVHQIVSGQPWAVQLSQPIAHDLRPGDHLWLRFWACSPDRLFIEPIVELSKPPWSKLEQGREALTPQWKEFRRVIVMPAAAGSGTYSLRFRLGFQTGSLEIGGIRLENYGPQPTLTLEENRDPWAGQPLSDAWRSAAQKRIRRYRQGGLKVVVLDREGRPFRGAQVHIQQRSHAFRFGTAVNSRLLTGTEANSEKYRRKIKELFNYITIENGLKWRHYELRSYTEKTLQWAAENHLAVRGHCLFWPSFRYIPEQLQDLRDPPALRQAIHDHLQEYATRYRGQVVVWDVINEAVTNTEIPELVGQDILADAFRWTREADPDVLLCWNDYGILQNPWHQNDWHIQKSQELLASLLQQQAPVDLIGMQAHMSLPLTPISQVLATLDDYYRRFHLPIEITEFDLGCTDDRLHAQYVADFMTACFSHPAVRSFVRWGFWAGSHWRGGEGGAMLRRDWSERPTAQRYRDLVFQQWWTKEQGQTDAQGLFHTRVFLGEQEVTVSARGKQAQRLVTVSEPGEAEKTAVLRLR